MNRDTVKLPAPSDEERHPLREAVAAAIREGWSPQRAIWTGEDPDELRDVADEIYFNPALADLVFGSRHEAFIAGLRLGGTSGAPRRGNHSDEAEAPMGGPEAKARTISGAMQWLRPRIAELNPDE